MTRPLPLETPESAATVAAGVFLIARSKSWPFAPPSPCLPASL